MDYHTPCKITGRTGWFTVGIDGGTLVELSRCAPAESSVDELWLSPGMFDIQVNGMLGHNLSDENLTVEGVRAIEEELNRRGTTRWCPTVTTQNPAIVERNLKVIRTAIESNQTHNIHCIHLEGHYISAEDGYRGVHAKQWIRDPDPAEFERWQQAAGGHIGLFSLAPERAGALDFIQSLKKQGIRVGLVHHHAPYDIICAAAASGADLSSHLVNGCAPMVNRQHNVIWAQLSLDELWASLIPDGYHIPFYTLKAVIKSKGIEQSILVSDLAHLSGLEDGEYVKGGLHVVKKNGGLWVKGEGSNLLAGAVRTLDEGCSLLASEAGFSIDEALIMASDNPYRYFGMSQNRTLFAGYSGPMVVFSWNQRKLKIKEVYDNHGKNIPSQSK
ncbi:MAG: hypothetical protein VB025_02685 [Sphaerochaeta sp.]|nr:hypothetical protein [Sphaerochaeta sp.]